jgi:hypothetical protein
MEEITNTKLSNILASKFIVRNAEEILLII